MGQALRKLRETDPDILFSYRTVKVVKILDRRLGILHYTFILAVILYVFGFTILYQKRYVKEEVPVGSVHMQLWPPAEYTPATELEYCAESAVPSAFPKRECRYWDAIDVVYPVTEATDLLATTRVSRSREVLNCSLATAGCAYQKVDESTIFVPQVENMTLKVSHTMSCPTIGIQRNAKYLDGKLIDTHGHVVHASAPHETIGEAGKDDIITLGHFLKAAGIETLDRPSLSDETESMRHAGVVLLVFITYSNTFSFDLGHFQYRYTVKAVPETEYKSTQPIYNKLQLDGLDRSEGDERVLWDRHGLRLIFVQSGSVGAFDFQTMLINLVSGLGLLAVATVVVDMLAVWVMPEKDMYAKYKFQETADFSDIRDGLIEISEDSVNTLSQPMLTDRRATTAM